MIFQQDGKHFQWLVIEPEVVQNSLSDRRKRKNEFFDNDKMLGSISYL